MKTIFINLMILLLSLPAFSASLVTCDGLTNSDRTLILAIRETKLVQVRVQTQGSLPHALIATLLSTHGNTSIYTIMGMGPVEILELENSVLRLEGGKAEMAGDRFDCASN